MVAGGAGGEGWRETERKGERPGVRHPSPKTAPIPRCCACSACPRGSGNGFETGAVTDGRTMASFELVLVGVGLHKCLKGSHCFNRFCRSKKKVPSRTTRVEIARYEDPAIQCGTESTEAQGSLPKKRSTPLDRRRQRRRHNSRAPEETETEKRPPWHHHCTKRSSSHRRRGGRRRRRRRRPPREGLQVAGPRESRPWRGRARPRPPPTSGGGIATSESRG